MEAPKLIFANDLNMKTTTELIGSKNYELQLNSDIYCIIIELYSNKIIRFKAKKKNKTSVSNYSKEYMYEELIKKLFLQKDFYDNIDKLFKFLDKSL